MQIISRKLCFFALVCTLFFFQLSQASISAASTLSSSSNAIIWETIDQPEYMDPHKNYEHYGSWIHFNVYETLFTYPWDTANTTPSVPLLAESLAVSADGLTYTFTLRQGVTFHDGTEFNATCVQKNFWRMLGRGWDYGYGPVWMIAEPILGGQAIEDAVYEYGDGSPEHIAAWNNWVANVNAVVVNSMFEVEIHLAYPFSPFIAVLTHPVGSMISPTFFMAHGGMSPQSSDQTLDIQACGTGPYVLDQWVLDDRIELSLNENYWRADSAKATHPNAGAITDITIKLRPDVNARILNLRAGITDACDWPTSHAYMIWNNVTTIGDGTLQSLDPNLKVWAGNPTFGTFFIGFNMYSSLNVSGEIRENPFASWELRAAVSYAFDYSALIRTYLNGLGIQLQGPIPMDMFAHKNDLFMFELDMPSAVMHWNNAMANGLDVILANNSYELKIYYNLGNPRREAAGLMVKDALENIIADSSSTNPSSPLTIDVIGIEWSNYRNLMMNHNLAIFFDYWTPDFADPSNYVTSIVKTTGFYAYQIGLEGSAGSNGSVWDASAVDGWIDAAAAEYDDSARVVLYNQIQEAIVDHCAYIWCYQATSFHVESALMNGYVFNPMHDPYLYHYYKSNGVTTTTTPPPPPPPPPPTTTDRTTPSDTTSTGTTTGLGGGEIPPLVLGISIGSSMAILVVIVLIYRSRKTP